MVWGEGREEELGEESVLPQEEVLDGLVDNPILEVGWELGEVLADKQVREVVQEEGLEQDEEARG